MKTKDTVSVVHQPIGIPFAYGVPSGPGSDRRLGREDTVAVVHPPIGIPLAYARGSDQSRAQRAPREGAFFRNTIPKALVTALLSILLAGCELRGKPAKSAVPPAAPKPVASAAPAPAPPPALSIPQTRVELPK